MSSRGKQMELGPVQSGDTRTADLVARTLSVTGDAATCGWLCASHCKREPSESGEAYKDLSWPTKAAPKCPILRAVYEGVG